ncbi:MAG: hypothetical protein WCV67_13160 [Victivallaceae bacterium]|jgi:hypothetical protein
MKPDIKNQGGFATIFVLMLAAALLIILAATMKSMYAAHDQNKKDKQQIIRKAGQLNSQYAGQEKLPSSK